jgi:outer membrane protein assembly factor BamB
MMKAIRAVLLLVLAWAVTHPLGAEPPVGWRNDGTGRFPTATPPTTWSAEKNIQWKVTLPGASYGAPIVVGENLFVVSDPGELLCIRRSDGKILWRKANTDIKAPPVPRMGFGMMGGNVGKPLLDALDTNKDGKVTKEEVVAGVKKFFADNDKDKKGHLTEKQNADGLGRICPAPPGFGRPGGGRPGGGRPGGAPGGGRFGRFNPGTMIASAIVRRADTNKDGKVTLKELTAAAEALFKEIDKDKKGKLDDTQLGAAVTALMPRGGFGRPGGGFGGFLSKPLLNALDTDKDSKLSKAELLAGVKKFFTAADKDKKGSLDQEQLAAELNRILPAPPGFGGGAPGGRPRGFGMGTFLARGIITLADKNKDGKVTLKELETAAEALFQEIDKDKKGKLDESAITAAIAKVMPAPRFGGGGAGRPGGPGGRGAGGFGGPGGGFGMTAGNTAATPVSDGKHVVSVLGNGVVTVYTVDGKRIWGKFLESPQIGFGHTAAPLLLGGKLIVHIKDVVALDIATGKEIWRVALRASHASPVVLRLGKEDLIISPAGSIVRARDGKVLARDKFYAAQGSPVVAGDTLYLFERKLEAFKLSLGEKEELKVTELWSREAPQERYHIPSPVVHNGLLYGVTTSGFLEALDVTNGNRVYRQRLGVGQVYSSVALAGDLLYVFDTRGKAVVFKPGRRYVRVATNELEETGCCPVFAGDHLYMRGQKNLYCVSAKGKKSE